MAESDNTPAAFAGQVDLANAALGGRCLACSDDFFAEVDNLVKPEPAVFDPDAYTERGKEMDGWESRRKRVPGHDWAILELGVRGEIRGVDIDTAFFMGNHPPYASVEACNVSGEVSVKALRESQVWTEIVPSMPLQRGSHNLQAVSHVGTWTHVRLRIYPDGGVARLRVWGDPRPVRTADAEVDVACVNQGGRALACSDMFFSPMNNLVLPQPAVNMGGGWETRRSRPPSDDWIIVQLGSPAIRLAEPCGQLQTWARASASTSGTIDAGSGPVAAAPSRQTPGGSNWPNSAVRSWCPASSCVAPVTTSSIPSSPTS